MQTPRHFPEEMSDEGYKSWSSSVCILLQFPIRCTLLTPTFVLILVNPQASFCWSYKNLVARCRGDRQLLHLCVLVYCDEWIEVSLGKWEGRKKPKQLSLIKISLNVPRAAACRPQNCVTLQLTTAGFPSCSVRCCCPEAEQCQSAVILVNGVCACWGESVEPWSNSGAFAKLRRATISFMMSIHPSVCPHEPNSSPTGRIFVKFVIGIFSPRKSDKKIKNSLKSDAMIKFGRVRKIAESDC